jgi:hypothetical protein
VELRIGYEAADLEDLVGFGIEPCHLADLSALHSLFRTSKETCKLVQTSQSTHTSGAVERCKDMLL